MKLARSFSLHSVGFLSSSCNAIRLSAILALSSVFTLGAAEPFVHTGIAEIDHMRRDFAAHPTTPENASRRHALIFSWVRLLVHRGVDMADFHDACAAFSKWGPIDPSRYPAMQGAYEALEKIQSNPGFIGEVRGTREKPSPSKTDWPVFGGNLEQSGLSPDAGPRTGEVAWKFPVGMWWYASAAVEDGRVYIASPGVTTLAYCLDDKTGKIIWHYTGASGWTGSASTPKLLWCTRVDGIFHEFIPAIHGDRAFILCSDGYLCAFE